MLINTKTGATQKELTLPDLHPEKAPHLQFRRVHLTKDNTYLAAHLNDYKVSEYDADGKEIWSFATPLGPWDAVRLKNGNTLISCYNIKNNNTVLEVTKQGEVVWRFSQTNAPEYKFFIFQEVNRLDNGNTVICNWCPGDLKDPKTWPGSVQILEVTPEKKVVWALERMDKIPTSVRRFRFNCSMSRARRKIPVTCSGDDFTSHIVKRNCRPPHVALVHRLSCQRGHRDQLSGSADAPVGD